MLLARAPIGVGACADADEGGSENAKSKNGGENCGVHTCSLMIAGVFSGPYSLREGLSVVSSVRAVMRS